MNAPLRLPELWSALPDAFAAAWDPSAPWALLGAPLDALLAALPDRQIASELGPHVHLIGERIVIGKGARIAPGVVLQGPLWIGDEVDIRTGAYVRGGCFIGDGCTVGANTEVKRSILLPEAKAPHLNYVGDSILGSDVNLGAGTVLSNFRHDGKQIVVPDGARAHRDRTAQAGRDPRRRRQDRLQQRAPPRRHRRARHRDLSAGVAALGRLSRALDRQAQAGSGRRRQAVAATRRGGGSMETLIHDLRFALRVLLRKPAFLAIAVVSLALGIGANTAIFSLVNELFLRPLPIAAPDRVMRILPPTSAPGGRTRSRTSTGRTCATRARRSSRSPASTSSGAAIAIDGEPRNEGVLLVSGNYFETLGVRPYADASSFPRRMARRARIRLRSFTTTSGETISAEWSPSAG